MGFMCERTPGYKRAHVYTNGAAGLNHVRNLFVSMVTLWLPLSFIVFFIRVVFFVMCFVASHFLFFSSAWVYAIGIGELPLT